MFDFRIKVFVYGSLRSGESNHSVLTNHGAELVSYSMETDGLWTMLDTGSGFPAVIPGDTATVFGEVYAVTPTGLAALDQLEGYRPGKASLYDRKTVTLHDGSKALFYFMAGKADWMRRAEVVTHGDWTVYLDDRWTPTVAAPTPEVVESDPCVICEDPNTTEFEIDDYPVALCDGCEHFAAAS